MKENKVRKGIHLSESLASWYEEKAKELGVSQTSLIVMAMDSYRNQQEVLELSKKVPGWLALAKEMQEKKEKNDDI